MHMESHIWNEMTCFHWKNIALQPVFPGTVYCPLVLFNQHFKIADHISYFWYMRSASYTGVEKQSNYLFYLK